MWVFEYESGDGGKRPAGAGVLDLENKEIDPKELIKDLFCRGEC